MVNSQTMNPAMPSFRPLPEIDAEMAAAARRLAELGREKTRIRAVRRAGIVADFDGGLRRAEIAAKWGVEYGHVAAILHRAGRTERTRRARGLSHVQRVEYQRLVRQGVSTVLSRAIALALRDPS
jgi:hypothetical protein